MTDTPTDKKLSLEDAFEIGFNWARGLTGQTLEDSRAVGRTLGSDLFTELTLDLAGFNSFESADAGITASKAIIKRALRLAESHPSAIREAVEGEREACAKLVAAYGIAGMPFDVGSWTPGAVAAAIRARGEEKGQ